MSTSTFHGRIVPGLLAVLASAAPLHAAPGSGAAAQGSDRRDVAREERMARWRSLRFGLFIHWGPYSEFGGTWEDKAWPGNTEWLMRKAQISRARYREAARQFDPEAFNADALVAFAAKNGFKYIVMTAKHYDGFALFDSKVSDFDAVDMLPSKRDLLKEFSNACRKGGMPLGFSYALDRDWYHPGGNVLGEVWDPAQAGSRDAYLGKVALPQLRELMEGYGPVFSLFADAGPGIPPQLVSSFQAALDPEVVVSRDFEGNNDFIYTDGVPLDHVVAPLDWEKCTCLGDSWGFRKGAVGWQASSSILRELVSTVSKGGNYLLNVGLDGEGRIPGGAEAMLDEVGVWLSKYGESIYGTSKSPFTVHPWNGAATIRNEGDKGATLYLHLFGKERREQLVLESLLTEPGAAEVMGSRHKLPISGRPGRWVLDLSAVEPGDDITVLRVTLPKAAVLGQGDITAEADGRFNLDVALGTYADSRTVLARRVSSPELQLTSFTDANESGTWNLHAEASASYRLKLTPAESSSAGGKTLLVRIGGEQIGEAVPAAGAMGTSSALESPPFRLPAGGSQIRISGSGEDKSSFPISTSKIELIPSH